ETSLSRTAGVRMTSSSAVLSLLITASGVPLGASTPDQNATTKSLTPASSIVGTSGSTGGLSLVACASATNRPDSTNGTTGSALLNITCTCPSTSAVSAGPPP